MSKIGKTPISLPEGVTLTSEGQKVTITGSKGSLSRVLPKGVSVKVVDAEAILEIQKDTERLKALHGTHRAILANMVKGVSEGWTKRLELVGTGYRAEGSGNKLVLTIGYSHPVEIQMPEGVSFKIEKTNIILEGPDKEVLGQITATIRDVRPPEPYKGKGIKYEGEYIRRKAGKAAKGQGEA